VTQPHTIRLKACCGIAVGNSCECLTSASAAAEWAALGRQRPPIILRPGPETPAEPRAHTSILLVNVNGLLRRVDSPALAEEQNR